jgi:3'-5' exoribonuclease
MKQYYVENLYGLDDITDFFRVIRSDVKTDSRGKQYLDVLLGDRTGEIAAKKWDVEPAEEETFRVKVRPGVIVKVRASVGEWMGAAQLKIKRIRPMVESDVIDMEDFVRAAPEPPQEMFDYIRAKAESITDEDYRKVSLALLDENREALLYYPAAKSNHHSIRSGLLWHVKRMLALGEKCCEVYEGLERDLLICGVIIHDIEKLREMDADEMGLVTDYTFEGQLLGHLVMGVRTIDRLATELGISKEKAVMLEHMMLSHHYEPEFGSPKKPLFPEAEVLHHLDMIDARLYDFEDTLKGVQPGSFSDWVRSLDGRRVYKPEYKE